MRLGVALATAAIAGACDVGAPDRLRCRDGLAPDRLVASTGPGSWEREGRDPELEELWRAGGLREGEALALPIHVAASRTGRLAVTDFRLGEVVVIDRDGTWLGAWTTSGEGPGEVRRPVAAAWTEGGRLVVFDVTGTRVVWLDDPGEVARERQLDPGLTGPVVARGSVAGAAVAADGTVFLQPGPDPVAGEALAVDVLLRSRPNGGGADTVRADTVPTVAAAGSFAARVRPGAPRLRFALGPKGRLVTTDPGGRYRLVERGPDLDTVRSLCRPVEPAPLTPEERGGGEVPDGRRPLADAIAGAAPPSRRAAVGSIFMGARGRFWVQRDRPDPYGDGAPGTPGAAFDVFSAEGRYLGGVEAPHDARLRAAAGDTVWALVFGELDEPEVVAYRLTRGR